MSFKTCDSEIPSSPFDLILCRYVAFTYFTATLQQTVLARMVDRLRPNGYFVIGSSENLPGGIRDLTPFKDAPEIFRKTTSDTTMRAQALAGYRQHDALDA